MRVLVTGSRSWTDPEPIHRALDDLAGRARKLVVVHGGARGADAAAAAWVAKRRAAGDRGATHCARTAEAAGIETRVTRWADVLERAS